MLPALRADVGWGLRLEQLVTICGCCCCCCCDFSDRIQTGGWALSWALLKTEMFYCLFLTCSMDVLAAWAVTNPAVARVLWVLVLVLATLLLWLFFFCCYSWNHNSSSSSLEKYLAGRCHALSTNHTSFSSLLPPDWCWILWVKL